MVNIDKNLKFFRQNRQVERRDASFDYCYNYFQGFRERDEIGEVGTRRNLESSCLQLGFYLASWGMMRGSTVLLQKSSVVLKPVILEVAKTPGDDWNLDVNSYQAHGSQVIALKDRIAAALEPAGTTETLVTKVLLGVFGCVPAFDTQFRSGFKEYCNSIGERSSPCNPNALSKLWTFYSKNQAKIDAWSNRIRTLDFQMERKTRRPYPKAKIIDMIFFIEGSK